MVLLAASANGGEQDDGGGRQRRTEPLASEIERARVYRQHALRERTGLRCERYLKRGRLPRYKLHRRCEADGSRKTRASYGQNADVDRGSAWIG